MDVTFDVVSDPSPVLSATVLKMDPLAQEALNATAETILGLAGKTFILDSDNQIVTLAVAYQMNYLAEIPDEAWSLHSDRRGQRAVTYRTARGQVMPKIAPLAGQVLANLSTAGWARGVRHR